MQRTEWHRVVVFGQGAKYLGEYGKKGSQIHVEGSLRTRDWTDKEGVKRYSTEIIGRQVQLLGKKEETELKVPTTEEPPATAAAEVPEEEVPF